MISVVLYKCPNLLGSSFILSFSNWQHLILTKTTLVLMHAANFVPNKFARVRLELNGYLYNTCMFICEMLHVYITCLLYEYVLYAYYVYVRSACNLFNVIVLFSSPGQRPCELLSWASVHRPSVGFSHLTLLLWNMFIGWSSTRFVFLV